MAACKPITFTGITREKFEAVCAQIEAQGHVVVVGDSGHASGNGFTAQWTYSEPAQTLIIQCTDKPFYVPESLVADKITALVQSIRTS